MTAVSSAKDFSTLVICCSDILDPNWRWIEEAFAGSGVRFELAGRA
jgi:hypothetical protein